MHTVAERRFEAMGTQAHVIVRGREPMPLLARARTRIDELEHLWSRFLPDSELSLLNASGGAARVVSRETYALLRHAVRGWRLTGGRFDPTVLDAVRAAGYTNTFFDLSGRLVHADAAVRPPGCGGIAFVDGARLVVLPPGVTIDPGGIGKGLAADLVVEDLRTGGASGACVNIGGDLRVFGRNGHGGDWIIDVEDPFSRAAPLRRLHVGNGAVATTSSTRRHWHTDAGDRHHLIDPTTGTSADTGIAAVTVVAGEGWLAEIMSKAAFLAGPAGAEQMLVANRAAGLLVTDDGAVRSLGSIDEYLT